MDYLELGKSITDKTLSSVGCPIEQGEKEAFGYDIEDLLRMLHCCVEVGRSKVLDDVFADKEIPTSGLPKAMYLVALGYLEQEDIDSSFQPYINHLFGLFQIKNSQMPDYSKSKRGAKTMYQVIKALVLEGKHGCLIYREDLKIFEGLSLDLNEAVDAVCIEFGISSDDFDPNIRDMGHQVQIRI